jgi:hypothetical protein
MLLYKYKLNTSFFKILKKYIFVQILKCEMHMWFLTYKVNTYSEIDSTLKELRVMLKTCYLLPAPKAQ